MAETARMRGLLAELGRLGAEEAEAPTRLEGASSVAKRIADAASYAKNYGMFMSAGYVTP